MTKLLASPLLTCQLGSLQTCAERRKEDTANAVIALLAQCESGEQGRSARILEGCLAGDQVFFFLNFGVERVRDFSEGPGVDIRRPSIYFLVGEGVGICRGWWGSVKGGLGFFIVLFNCNIWSPIYASAPAYMLEARAVDLERFMYNLKFQLVKM